MVEKVSRRNVVKGLLTTVAGAALIQQSSGELQASTITDEHHSRPSKQDIACISGKILDENEQPVNKAIIEVFHDAHDGEGQHYQRCFSDSQGNYKMQMLLPETMDSVCFHISHAKCHKLELYLCRHVEKKELVVTNVPLATSPKEKNQAFYKMCDFSVALPKDLSLV